MPDYILSQPFQGYFLSPANVPFELRRHRLSFATARSASGGFGSCLQQDYSFREFGLETWHFSLNETLEIYLTMEEPLHMLIFQLEGNMAIDTGSRKDWVQLKKNSHLFFYLPGSQKQSMRLEKGKSTFLNIFFTHAQLVNIAEAYGMHALVQYHNSIASGSRAVKTGRRMREQIREILSCRAVGSKLDLFLKVRLLNILIDLIDDADIPILPRFMSPTNTKQINEVGTFILANLDKPLNNTILAKRYGKGITAFKMDFTFHYKMPPHAFVKRERLLRSKSLILQTEEQVSTIAIMVGYTEMTGFNRSFKKMFGNTPIWFRKNKV